MEIIVETCFSKFNLLSLSIPESVTESTDEMIIELFVFKSYLFSFLSQLDNSVIIAWNVSGFTIISFILNQSMADLLYFSNTFLSSSILFLVAYIVLPSEKFAS